MVFWLSTLVISLAVSAVAFASDPSTSILIQNTPAYHWSYGCYGTGCGMLFAYWDRNGYSNIYTGPTAGGVAPLVSSGTNVGVVSLWASQAGVDGRPIDQYGHVDDYYVAYESTNDDPWLARGIVHKPDCIGDFIGMSRKEWTNLNDECRGNIDAYAFNFFDASGARRVNFQPVDGEGQPIPDIQSGIRAFAAWRGYDADSFSQLLDIWHDTPSGTGFTFEDLRREIDSGRPVLIHLQAQTYANNEGYNPPIHAFLAVGYEIIDGTNRVRVRTGWSANAADFQVHPWSNTSYYTPAALYPRGAIGIRFKSVITNFGFDDGAGWFEWLGPGGLVSDSVARISWAATWHVVEAAPSFDSRFTPISTAAPNHRIDFSLPPDADSMQVFRLRRLEPTYMRDKVLHSAVMAAVPSKWGPTNLLYDLDLESIGSLEASAVGITNLWGLQGATSLTNLVLDGNGITDLAPLLMCRAAGGLPSGSYINITGNPLSNEALTNQIPQLLAHGITVDY